VALAISLVTTLAVISYISLTNSQGKVETSGQDYSTNYLGQIDALLDEIDEENTGGDQGGDSGS
jgi:hypothetical protein